MWIYGLYQRGQEGILATPEEITVFLKKFKQVLTQGFIIIPRPAYKTTVAYLGIKISYLKNIISHLTYKDYINGPEKDRDRPGNMIWEFGNHIQGEDIYIKLSDDFNFNRAKCLSFHIAAHPLRYPYKPN